MKKFLAILLAALLITCMVGCGKDEAPEIDNSDDGEAVGEEMVKDNFKYAVNDKGDYEIVGYVTDGAADLNLTIPKEIDGRPVTGIGTDAFKALKNLKSFKVEADNNNLTYIGQGAFWGCDGLVEVTLPNTVTEIGKIAFQGCSNLTKITLSNKLVTIDEYAFAYCEKLATIELPETLTTIGVGAFFDCDALKTVTISKNVTFIGKGAFVECKSLTDVVFTETANWYSATPDENGNFAMNFDEEIIYVPVEAAALAASTDNAILLGDGVQLKRVLPEA
ncbi:MAG: leucine-rich repeat domain-containing protein [Ruminococcaceae bacterium]|nr:leucine-rich repeat domain-containing protein [Oscillospiraceae bacterium]